MPHDAEYLFWWSSRSQLEEAQRAINAQKFYATLPHKIDNEVEEYLAAIEEATEAEWEFWEQQDGETALGGAMGLSSNLIKDNTPERDGD